MDDLIDRIAQALDGKPDGKGGYMCLCPAHDDRNPSLNISPSNNGGNPLVHCFAGCSQEAVIETLKSRNLWPSRNGDRPPAAADGLALEDFAKKKKLDQVFLLRNGVTQAQGKDGKPYVIFNYRDVGGKTVDKAVRFRFSMSEKPKSKKGGTPALYGLWRLNDFRPGGEIILCEGESDTLTFWSHNLQAVGIPGKGLLKTIEPEHFKGFHTVYVWQEPDAPELPGKVAARLPGLTVKALIPPNEIKDISEAHTKGKDIHSLVDRLKAQAQAVEKPSRPIIQVNDRQLRDSTEEAAAALETFNHPPEIFVRLGRPCRIQADEDERPVIENLDVSGLRHYLTKAADFVRAGKEEVRVSPPKDLVENILAAPSWPFPALKGIVEVPVLRPDGSILTAPGYDPPTKLYYRPIPGFQRPGMKVDLTAEDAYQAATFLLDELLKDFPFADGASWANVLAALLTPTVRHAIKGPVPLAVIDAPQAGTGKTLIQQIIGMLSTGRWAAMLSPPMRRDNDEEWGKVITSALLKGSTVICFDNCDGILRSPSLAMALTTEVYSARKLGTNEAPEIPVNCSWYVNGNNVQLGGDLPRRCYWIRLDAQMSRPWEREGFKHKDLKKWSTENRGRLIVALLTMAKAWFNAGKPEPDTAKLGSYEDWCRTVGGILQFSGVQGFLGNLEEMYEKTDTEGPEWEAFLLRWIDSYGDRPVLVKEIVAEIQSEDSILKDYLPSYLSDAGKNLSKVLGWAFKKMEGRHFGEFGVRLVRVPTSATNASGWKVVRY